MNPAAESAIKRVRKEECVLSPTKKLGGLFAGFAILSIVLNLAFWLALIAGALWLCKHFGVIH